MSAETTLLANPLEHIASCLSDICLALDAIRYDLQDIQSQLHQREEVEARLRFLECLMNSTLMDEGDTDGPSLF